jgi:hypothetical protein
MMITYVAVGVAITCFILYTLDRKSKDHPVEWDVAIKLASLGAMLSGGVAYAVGAEDVTEVVTSVAASAQEMFVGKPEF